MTTDDTTTERRIAIDWAWRAGPDGDRLGQLLETLADALADLGVTLRETTAGDQVQIVLSRTGETAQAAATCGCDAQADADHWEAAHEAADAALPPEVAALPLPLAIRELARQRDEARAALATSAKVEWETLRALAEALGLDPDNADDCVPGCDAGAAGATHMVWHLARQRDDARAEVSLLHQELHIEREHRRVREAELQAMLDDLTDEAAGDE